MAILEILWLLEIFVDLATATEMQILTILTGVIIEQVNAWNVWGILQAGNATDALMVIMEILYQGSVKVGSYWYWSSFKFAMNLISHCANSKINRLYCLLACKCNQFGSSSEKCDPLTGQCPCKEKYVGRTCSRCKVFILLA